MGNYFVTCFSGAKNMGDEFILKCLVEKIKQYDNSAQIVASSLNPHETEKLIGNDISAIEWHGIGITKKTFKNMLGLYREIKSTDYVIVGGGGLLQDVHSVATIPRYLLPVIFAKAFNKKVIYFSMGAGPIENKHLVHLTKKISNKFVDHITVRDEKSKKYLNEIGVETQIEVTSDPVFLIEEFIKPKKLVEKNRNQKSIGISFRQFKTNDKIENELEILIEQLLLKKEYSVTLFPLDLSEDKALCDRLKSKYKIIVIDNYSTIEEVVVEISKMDYMISMRLHGVITSASYGIPSIAVSYDEKVKNIQTKIGMKDYIIDINQFTASICLEKFSNLESSFLLTDKKFLENVEKEKKIMNSSLKDSLEFADANPKKGSKIISIYYFVKLFMPQILKKLFK